MQSSTVRCCDPGEISHKIYNHDILWSPWNSLIKSTTKIFLRLRYWYDIVHKILTFSLSSPWTRLAPAWLWGTLSGPLGNIMVEWCTDQASSPSAKISKSSYLSTQALAKLVKYLLIFVCPNVFLVRGKLHFQISHKIPICEIFQETYLPYLSFHICLFYNLCVPG